MEANVEYGAPIFWSRDSWYLTVLVRSEWLALCGRHGRASDGQQHETVRKLLLKHFTFKKINKLIKTKQEFVQCFVVLGSSGKI